MSWISPDAYDEALTFVMANGQKVTLCSTEPTTFAQIATLGLATDNVVVMSGPAAGASSGRKATIPASQCIGTAAGSAGFWALHDGASILVATGALSVSVTVVAGVVYDYPATDITIKGAVNA